MHYCQIRLRIFVNIVYIKFKHAPQVTRKNRTKKTRMEFLLPSLSSIYFMVLYYMIYCMVLNYMILYYIVLQSEVNLKH